MEEEGESVSTLHIVVYGVAQPQGSARLVPVRGYARPFITTDNKKLRPWRQEVAQTALAVMRETGTARLRRDVPVEICVRFLFEKPKSVRKSAHWKTTNPDVDKLLRAVLDALTGIAYEDDAHVCESSLVKAFGSPARAWRSRCGR